jgi:hypothetical protein
MPRVYRRTRLACAEGLAKAEVHVRLSLNQVQSLVRELTLDEDSSVGQRVWVLQDLLAEGEG